MNQDYDTPETVRALMLSSTDEASCNANADKVKAPDGMYPGFWFQEIILSGLAAQVLGKDNATPRVVAIR